MFIDLTPLVQVLFRSCFVLFFCTFFALHTNGKRCNRGSRSCSSQSQVVYAYHVLSLCSKGLSSRSTFLTFFGPDMKTEMGVIMIYMYLKHSPDYIDSKYMWVHESNSLGSSVSAERPFLAFLALHREKNMCGQVDYSPCYSQSEVVYAYKVLDL